MTTTIKRGTAARRPAPRRRQPKAPWGDRMLARLPIGEAGLRRAATLAFLLAGGAVAIAAASWLGVPAAIGGEIADATARAGFRVEQVEITGLKRMDQMTVYAVALEDKRRETPMASVDLAAIRDRLLQYGWIKDAHVSRRLPDTLLIRIDERIPAAVWQNEGQLTLIDQDGVMLEPVDANRLPHLPLLIGPGADRQETGLHSLLAAAPDIGRQLRAATWVGNRRWDLNFRTGETLALPEGDDNGAAALARFASMQASRPLLGKGWVRFDMRDPTRLVARRAGAQAADAGAAPAVDAKPTKATGGTSEG
jgi:cell division protein FtsQ